MKTFIITAAIILAGFIGINAQEKYVGFQYVNTNPDKVLRVRPIVQKSDDFYGVVGSATSYFTPAVGVNGEVSANFSGGSQPSQIYTATGGLTLRYNGYKSIKPFVKGNGGFGVLHTNRSAFGPSDSDVSPVFKVSTGVDLGKGKTKFRLFEVGYLQTHFYGQRQDNVVVSTGITF